MAAKIRKTVDGIEFVGRDSFDLAVQIADYRAQQRKARSRARRRRYRACYEHQDKLARQGCEV
jgi:hypothetical protein